MRRQIGATWLPEVILFDAAVAVASGTVRYDMLSGDELCSWFDQFRLSDDPVMVNEYEMESEAA